VALSAIGVDVSVEKRGTAHAGMLAVSLVGLFVGAFTIYLAAKIVLWMRHRNRG